MNFREPVVIVGAGFSGMSLAWELSKAKIPVWIIEKTDKVGGMIQTRQTKFGLSEAAANGFLRTQRVEQFLLEIGVPIKISSQESKRRYIFRDRIRKWPLTFGESFKTFLKIFYGVLRGPRFFRPRPMETISQWGHRAIGPVATENLLCVALQGIYGPDTGRLSAELVLGPIFRKGKSRRQSQRIGGLVTGREGMSSIMEHLRDELKKRGVEFRLEESFDWQNYPTAAATVLCTSADDANILLAKKFPKVASLLSQIKTWDVASVKIFSAEETKVVLPGFGILFPKINGFNSLGVLFNSTIFGWPQKSETWILPSEGEESVSLRKVFNDRKEILRLEQNSVTGYQIDTWEKGLPVYDVEMKTIIDQIKNQDELRQAKVFLHGNYLGSIGLSRLMEDSEHLAQKINTALKA